MTSITTKKRKLEEPKHVKLGNRRKTGKEQYYTLPSIAEQCVDLSLPFIQRSSVILEPAGGKGDFIEALLKKKIENIVSYDIEPKHPLVQQKDFLLLATDSFSRLSSKDVSYCTISNPPFGRASSLAVKFFNHSASFSKYICFLVPKAWRKWSVQNRLNLNFHLVLDEEMPSVCFYDSETENPYTGSSLNTVFQVWEYREEKRRKIQIEDRGYLKKCSPKEADVAVTFFGYSCGRVETKETGFERSLNSTKSFFKVRDETVVEALQKVDFSRFYKNVSYTEALSLMEVNYLLNEFFDDKKGEPSLSLEEFFL